jgi:uncharacterized membrane protein
MDDVTIARIIHILAIVFWIGGVAMVTTVLLPAVRRFKSPVEQLQFFDRVERRFANQSRVSTLLAGLSGLYMVWKLDAWSRFAEASFWWMDAMVLVWLIFTLMLFVAEPLFLHRWLEARAKAAPEATFRLVARLHWTLLTLSLITVIGAAAGAHGLFFF